MPLLTRLQWTLVCLGLLFTVPVNAQQTSVPDALYVADLALESPEEFAELLERAQGLVTTGVNSRQDRAQVTFVLHGPVLNNLLRENYLDNKQLADLAASLSALQVIELKACRTWMGRNGIEEAQLLPFIETVDYAPNALREAVREQHRIYF